MSRWFVVGNGPSLNHTPLDELQNENTIGMNRIHLIYDKTDWRPTIYVRIDYSPSLKHVWKHSVNLHLDMGIKCYLWDAMKDGHPEGHPNHDDLPDGVGEHDNAIWVPRCEHHYYQLTNVKAPKQWHLPEICTPGSSIGACIQIAILEGATEIYLLGCDLGSDAGDHFSPNYRMKSGNKVTEKTYEMYRMTHELAKRSSPVPIYNATVGGSLEVYPRVDINDIVPR